MAFGSMKNRFLILLGLCLCALLACGQDTAQTAVDPTAVPAATAAATPTASPIPLPTPEPPLAPVELQGQARISSGTPCRGCRVFGR